MATPQVGLALLRPVAGPYPIHATPPGINTHPYQLNRRPAMNSADQQAGTPQDARRVVPPAARRRKGNRAVWILLLGLAVVLLAGGGAVVAATNAGWSTDTPEVLGIAPPTGSRDVAGDTPITIAFNMPMNQDSVRAHL